jgi:hypothetical protein
VTLRASPDGVGPGGFRCPGCDGVITGADRSKAAGSPLPPVAISVRSASGTYHLDTQMEPVGNTGSVAYYFAASSPPPYEVTVPSGRGVTDVPGYALCPNSPSTVTITQADFDRYSAARPGRGRRYEVDWRFLPLCGWLDHLRVCPPECFGPSSPPCPRVTPGPLRGPHDSASSLTPL